MISVHGYFHREHVHYFRIAIEGESPVLHCYIGHLQNAWLISRARSSLLEHRGTIL